MKKLQFNLEGREMLTKEQMKQINGGTSGCDYYSSSDEKKGSWACSDEPCACQAVYDEYCTTYYGCAYVICSGCEAS